ncbi:S-adenosyl-l-methionine hydroxide adenosyltransferase family protein [Candidatus Aciduliprofundum boonei]|uniref:SAM-dependent chlorinase/fluorinase n=1 Tax=Aciduliprofundum boonei (strain DSM 19572 / T469) TaxID=439481 RepID=B5IFP7_ACIB4|nr:SAM-dependent chlorinase/fluorinase [Candidatus Aciduliprofundum boonei]ADD08977.1 protein of unknown function DUF62 [Aciduliprofundum boonei T469]EDY34916.1 conserved hypothetical protein [Aciduliprofundum boonei T469]HII55193.1 SAM-dependent chlorinase/fluorinase [Candidatus Aciduliprofundum boonei]
MITLTTDFGYKDHYVGVMKGVILKINPHAKIVDITHNVERHSIRHAAYVLNAILPYFPPAVHVFVVDPGVGTERKGIAAKIENSWYVGPDNGILTYVAHKVSEVYELQIEPESTTFHGRDVFAPAAAYIDMGNFEILKKTENFEIFEYRKAARNENRINCEVIHIDHFGNVITNVPKEMVKDAKGIEVIGKTVRFLPSYGHAKKGELIALVNSENFLEFAVNQGDASKRLALEVGDKMEIIVQQ